MEVTGGSLSYTATIDYSQLEAAVKNIESRLSSLEGYAESTGEALDNMGSGLNKVLAAIGGIAALKSFTTQMFNVRKSFQDTQSVMEVFLGSAEKAEAHLKELQKYAWYNMFDFETLTQASAQLQAFGTEVEDVIPIVDRLSNIAAGTKTDLMDLVASFNRAKSVGFADSRMLISFATKGLDVVKILREMGIAVSSTSVTFDQLMTAVEAATNEGGRFYNLMDAQFENLSSLAGAVEDDISIMFNEIGEKLQPTMESILKATHTLIDNYETIGRVLAVLLTTYGAYRAALITTTIVQNLQAAGIARLTALEKVHYAWLVLQEKAQALLNKTMLSNPYVLLATVIVGAIAGLVAYAKATNDTRTAEEKLNDTLEERLNLHNQLKEEANGYIDTIVNEKENVEALNEAYEKLIELEPFKGMSIEELRGKSAEELRQMIGDWDTQAVEQEINSMLNESLNKWYRAYAAMKAPLTEVGSLSKKAAFNTANEETLPEIYAANKKYTEQQIAELQKLDAAQRKIKYEEMIQNLQDMNTALQESDETAQYYGMTMSKNAPLIAMNNQAIDLLTQNLEALNSSTEANSFPIFEDVIGENGEVAMKSLVTLIKEAEDELKGLREEMILTGNYTPEMIDKITAAEKNLESRKGLYKTLTGREYGKSNKTGQQHRRAAEDAELALIKDSYQRERKAAQNAAQRKIEDLQTALKEEKDLTADARAAINREIAAVRQKLLQDLEDIDNAHIAQVIKTQKELQDLDRELIRQETDWMHERDEARIALMQDGFSKELEEMTLEHTRRLEEIERQAEEEARAYEEAAKKRFLLENQDKNEGDFYAQWTGIPQEEQERINKRSAERTASQQALFAKQTADQYRQLLTDYGDYITQKEDIDKKYFQDYTSAATRLLAATTEEERQQYDNLMTDIQKQWARADLNLSLDTIDATAYNTVAERMDAINDAYEKYIEALRQAGASEAEINAAIAEQVEQTGTLTRLEAERADLEARIRNIQNGGTDKEGMSLADLIAKLTKVNKEIESTTSKSFKELWNENKNTVVANSIDQVTEALQRLAEASGSLNAEQASQFMSSLSKGLKGFQQGGFIGLLVAGIEDTLAQITDAIVAGEALEASLRQAKVDKWKEDMAALMNQGKGGIFGDDMIDNLNGVVATLEESRKQMAAFGREQQELGATDFNRVLEASNLLSWRNWAELFGAETKNDVKAYFDALNKGYNNLEAHILRTHDRGWLFNFFGVDDKFESLKDVVEDLGYDLYDKYGNLNVEGLQAVLDTYEDLSDADRKWMEEAISYSEQYQEAMDNLAEYLTNLFGNVVDSVVDKVFEGATDMEEIVSDVGKKMAKDLMKSMIMARYFDGLEEQMLEVIQGAGGMTEQASAEIFGMFAQAMQNLEGDLPQWLELADRWSELFQFDTDATSIGPGTGLASTSQESIDLMNGQLNAMRTVQGRIDGTIQNILLEMRGFRGDMNSQMNRSNDKLDQIIDNTSTSGLGRSLGAYFG
ncbi:MAG: hypothetical protein K6G25_06570 [Bacteroidales bacterium]|nr:hypothetical protein [Bacteroidales bacterium]